MSDIRRFLGSSNKRPAALRADASPDKKHEPKPGPSKATSKKRPAKSPLKVLRSSDSGDSSGEEILPKSVRGIAKKKKVIVLNDSDDDIVVKKSTPKKSTPQKSKRALQEDNSPDIIKRKAKKAARFDSDDDYVESPKKSAKSEKHDKSTGKDKKKPKKDETDSEEEIIAMPKKKSRKSSQTSESEDDEMVAQTDSEDEFREIKKPKKQLKNQATLNFKPAKQATHVAPKVESKKTTVDAGAFFGAASKPSAKSTTQKAVEISPTAQKENKPAKAPKLDKHSTITPEKKTKIPKTAPQITKTDYSVPPRIVTKVPLSELHWVDKYKPTNPTQLIGMNGEKSPWNKLNAWLKDWGRHNLGEAGKVKKPRPPPWLAGQDGSIYKAVLLSGPPGIGKTTCANMVCKELGLEVVEMNASDVRSKKQLQAHIAQLTGCHQLEEFFGKKPEPTSEVRHVLIMDEVDGMSGSNDRAGLSELIDIIKSTKIPIICICNDRAHQKMRTLVNYCFDVRFPRPRIEQVRSRVMSIACQEKLKLSKEEIDELIEMSNHDVRQCIYNLQMRKTISAKDLTEKNVTLGPFEAARKLLSASSTLQEKQEMFFVDYSIMPLFVQENYLNIGNKERSPYETLKCLRRASEFIALGDIVDRTIRTSGAWKLLNEQSMLSAALPSTAMNGYLKAMITFPSWLGKNSTAGKRQRLARQLIQHAHLKVSANATALVSDYIPAFRRKLTLPLLNNGSDGVSEVVNTYVAYDLIRDDAEAINELAVWPGTKDVASAIPSKLKAAVTRALGKESRMLPYCADDISKGKKRGTGGSGDLDVEIDEEGNVVERGADDGEDDDDDDDAEDKEKEEKKKPAPTTATRGAGARGRGGRGRGAKK